MDTFNRIDLLLDEKNKSKRTMCIDLNMPYSTLSSMFQRRSKNIDVETLKKIADYLDTTLEYLVAGNENYKQIKIEPYEPTNKNQVTTIGRGGKFRRYTLTDEQAAAVDAMLAVIIDKENNKK